MKVIICGGRGFEDVAALEAAIKLSGFTIVEVVTGGANGADKMGDYWAQRNDRDRVVFHANWSGYGRMAGPLRNERMAEYADACIALPGGKGTADMISRAKAHGLLLYDAAATSRKEE
jgi:hypothetical protein